MAVPTDRESFKDYCMRKLGAGVININVSDEQIDDRVDEGLRFFYDYHFDGAEKIYYKHQLTANNFTDKYVTLPDNIIGAVRIFGMGFNFANDILLNARFQLLASDLDALSGSLVPYVMTMQHISLIDELLNGQIPIRYNQHTKRLYLDMDWGKATVGEYIIVEAYEVVDPEVFTDAWSNRLLQNYVTALIKQNWGSQLKKYSGMPTAGGITFNGQQIFDEATQEIKDLEFQIQNSSLPTADFVG